MRAFSLRSLYQEVNRPRDVDPDEFALATSPYLYSINARYEAYTQDDGIYRVSFNQEAIDRILSGLAPTLKRVRIQHLSTMKLWHNQRLPRLSWSGFFLDDSQHALAESAPARLETLIFVRPV